MTTDRTTLLASTIVFATGALWGFYWLPVRALSEAGLAGAWGTALIAGAAAALLAPVVMARWRHLARADRVALISIGLGGAAFALYSVGFVYGRVAIIILLWFLTPVWSTLIGHYLMRWPTPRLRLVAIAVGLAGLAVMLGADGDVPVPRGAGEWMALVGGMIWSAATTGIRTRPELAPTEAAFVFALGAMLMALVLAPVLAPGPLSLGAGQLGATLGIAIAAGGVWWVLSIASLLWATARLEPARVGILLMTEVLVGAVSAAWLAGETLSTIEIVGGSLVLVAGLLEVWPVRDRRGKRL